MFKKTIGRLNKIIELHEWILLLMNFAINNFC